MNEKIIFLIPGHGCQYYGMGKELYNTNFYFKKNIDNINRKIHEITNKSILDIIFKDNSKGEVFDEFKYTHLAIFIIEYSIGKTLLDLGIKPNYIVGASLGELVALALSEVISEDDMIKLLINSINNITSNLEKGKMIGIFDDVNKFYKNDELSKYAYVSGVYCKNNYTISLKEKDFNYVTSILKNNKVLYQVLPIQYSFHCNLIQFNKRDVDKIVKDIKVKKGKYKIISSVNGELLTEFSSDYLMNILTQPVLFEKCIENIKENTKYNYIDIGPMGNMQNLIRYILPNISKDNLNPIITPFKNTIKNYDKVIQKYTIKEVRSKMNCYIFAGQGSQFLGMGSELFDKYKDIIKEVDNILGYSIIELCTKHEEKLNITDYTQPAVFVINHLLYLEYIKNNTKPDFLAGHSLGEYNALVASGALDFETGLFLVKKRAELMGKAQEGGMFALTGIHYTKVKEIFDNKKLDDIFIANYNSIYQTVVAGNIKSINEIKDEVESLGGRVIRLNVSGAFHTKYMTEAKKEFWKYLEDVKFNEFDIPVISNLEGKEYTKNREKFILGNQIDNSVKWVDSIRYLLSIDENMNFVQISYGDSLIKLVDNIKNNTNKNELIKYMNKNMDDENKVTLGKSLGNENFKRDYRVKYAYIAGGMYRGISSVNMVTKLARKDILSFFGAGGLKIDEIDKSIKQIKEQVNDKTFGVNFVSYQEHPEREEELVDCLIDNGVTVIEAAAFMSVSEALVRYRLNGLKKINDKIIIKNRIILKASRPEIIKEFIAPPPSNIVNKLYFENKITDEERNLANQIIMIDDITVESDSGGHTDQGVAIVELPAIIRLKNRLLEGLNNKFDVRIGAAGGIGTPEAVLAMFIMGADYVVTGSINQCTVEAGISDVAKDMLQNIDIQDTDIAPAGDMFELGAKVQVVKKGVFFPARANKLYNLYKRYNSIEEISEDTIKQLENKYFKMSLNEVWNEIKDKYSEKDIIRFEENPKYKMAMIFKKYLLKGTIDAIEGNIENKINFQIQCGPALGALNQMLLGSEKEKWQNRHVDDLAILLMTEAEKQFNSISLR